MNRLTKIALSAAESAGVQFRRSAYGARGARSFLRDLLAIANADVDGRRYIVVGVDFDAAGQRRATPVGEEDFSGKPSWQALANEFIEPPIKLSYQPVESGGKQVGVFEIADCQDRPYMMRIDHSETLRRGDAYVRINNSAVKMGRRQLQSMFEDKFREAVSAADIEIGFPGDIVHKDRTLPVCDLDALPSAVACAKLRELIEIKSKKAKRGSTSMLARLTHARLFGSDDPYKNRGKDTLIEEMQQIEKQYEDRDAFFLFEEHARPLQLVVYNQGEEAIQDASVSLVMPNHASLHIASRLPATARDGDFVPRSEAEQSGYPTVNLSDDAVHVAGKLGTIPAGEFVDVFEKPLRICVGKPLEGRRFGIQYALFAQNLKQPVKGRLRLLFG